MEKKAKKKNMPKYKTFESLQKISTLECQKFNHLIIPKAMGFPFDPDAALDLFTEYEIEAQVGLLPLLLDDTEDQGASGLTWT